MVTKEGAVAHRIRDRDQAPYVTGPTLGQDAGQGKPGGGFLAALSVYSRGSEQIICVG